jgi:outer membrane protein OmpA-like peptidoglycan-associated protein
MKNLFNFLKLLFLAGLCINSTINAQDIELVPKKTKLQPIKMKISKPVSKKKNWRDKYIFIGDIFNNEDRIRVSINNNKWGFVNRNGLEIILCIYDDVWDFSEGLAKVKKNDKWGYIDNRGEIIIPIIYDDAWIFSDGLAKVKKDGRWIYIDKKGICVRNCTLEVNKENESLKSSYTFSLENELKEDAKLLKFIIGTDSITKIGLRVTTRIASNLADATFSKLKIISHTDNGNYKFSNFSISFNRAYTIKKLLSDKGVNASKIELEAKGDAEPIESNSTYFGREKNNRIELILIR